MFMKKLERKSLNQTIQKKRKKREVKFSTKTEGEAVESSSDSLPCEVRGPSRRGLKYELSGRKMVVVIIWKLLS